ncbi:MAG: 50S ribosomal protein L32 [Simkaniaceae bacterium]|nr:50S ribosomal protein L32 [Simkaniaceae bacterium]
MAVPRNRHSCRRTRAGRAHHAKKPVSVVVCTNCNQGRLPHTVCPLCGYYRGRSVFSEVGREETERGGGG